jgi:hypothetical protein
LSKITPPKEATVKKKVEVILTTEIELEIKDECLTPQFIAAFEACMFDLDPYSNFENKTDAMFAFAARQVAVRGEDQFIEGIGECVSKNNSRIESPNVRVLSSDEEFEENILTF